MYWTGLDWTVRTYSTYLLQEPAFLSSSVAEAEQDGFDLKKGDPDVGNWYSSSFKYAICYTT